MILGSQHIDHTNLKPTASVDDIRKLCDEARKYNFRGVCVHPCYVFYAANELRDTDIKLITVVSFPLGSNSTITKVFEADRAINDGADEIDVVWNIGAFKAKEYLKTVTQLGKIVEAAKARHDCFVKIIVEICYLNDIELEKAYQVVFDSGADYIKTSTGFGPVGSTTNELAMETWNAMRTSSKFGDLKIKISAGIRDLPTAMYFIEKGADILGTSHGVKIMEEKRVLTECLMGDQALGKRPNLRDVQSSRQPSN